ncbi:MAG: beta-lactamase family protein [Chitinispirillales bacterium]|jgi:CubicO group peptidase (beta-lactamase class C family)|nr:beta-lactamase family protein [Chitinispirillales bacterium]
MPDKNKIKNRLNSAIERRAFPGCAVGWVVDGDESVVTAGRFTYDVDAPIVTENSIFDCASITKSIPVSALALWMIDRGMMGINDRLIDYVPEYRGAFRSDIRVKHLLTHTLDFDFRLSEHKDFPPEKLLDSILDVKMKSLPGEKFCYANATSILLGMVLETVSCKSLHVLAKETFFDPLEMRDTKFFLDDANIPGCVPTENDPWRGRVIQGEVHDESAWTLQRIMTPGSAGMFSTVPDLLKFVKMLIAGGEPFFRPETVEAMYTNQIPHIKNQYAGLGWELNQEYMGANRSQAAFGKTGFTGCAVIIDITKKLGVVMLSNYTWPTRKPNRDLINEIRGVVADLVTTPKMTRV